MKSLVSLALGLLLTTQRTNASPHNISTELDSDLFEQLVAGKDQTKVKDGQRWFVFFTNPQACYPADLCTSVTEIWEDLTDHVF